MGWEEGGNGSVDHAGDQRGGEGAEPDAGRDGDAVLAGAGGAAGHAGQGDEHDCQWGGEPHAVHVSIYCDMLRRGVPVGQDLAHARRLLRRVRGQLAAGITYVGIMYLDRVRVRACGSRPYLMLMNASGPPVCSMSTSVSWILRTGVTRARRGAGLTARRRHRPSAAHSRCRRPDSSS